MALSPYRNKANVYRSRSTSFSSPNSRSFLYQEVLTTGESALVRSFSCGQFFTRGRRGETLESTQVRITNFVSPVKNSKANIKQGLLPEMRSKKNPQKKAIEFQCSAKPAKTSWKLFNLANMMYVNLFLCMVFCACYFFKYQYCNMEWKTEKMSSKLKQTVFGQDKVIMELAQLLKKFSKSEDSMTIGFIGSIGVGKTLVANIVHDYFPWEMNKHLHFFDSDTGRILLGKTYSSCGANLIIIDDLNLTNMRVALDELEKMPFINSKFLLILIFQSHNQNDNKVILERLNFSSFKIHSLVFNDLNHNDVKNCFKIELKRQGKYLPDGNLNEIVNEHMKYCNISKSYLGCKNVLNEITHM